MKSSNIHLTAIFTKDTSTISSKISMEITKIKFHSNLSGANELKS